MNQKTGVIVVAVDHTPASFPTPTASSTPTTPTSTARPRPA